MAFVPIVNPDGVNLIEQELKKFKSWYNLRESDFFWQRKNTHNYFRFNKCKVLGMTLQVGVDLNRNYDYLWNDTRGNSDDPCDFDYRGPYPFSEPETRAMRDFVLANQNLITFNFNYHSFGNLLVTPFSGHSDKENQKMNLPEWAWAKQIYDEMVSEPYLPEGIVYGSAVQTVNYQANGDAGDWILQNTGIIAATPELGSIREFDIDFAGAESLIILENMPLTMYMIKKSLNQIALQPVSMV